MVISVEIPEDLANTVIRGSETMHDVFKIHDLVKAAVILKNQTFDDDDSDLLFPPGSDS